MMASNRRIKHKVTMALIANIADLIARNWWLILTTMGGLGDNLRNCL
jgi:hypothetical protein